MIKTDRYIDIAIDYNKLYKTSSEAWAMFCTSVINLQIIMCVIWSKKDKNKIIYVI